MTAYRTHDVPVEGGTLRVGEWGATSGPVVLACHGITASHVSFCALADQLGNEVRLVAPDLRGRGRSREITGPWGMSAHASDVVATLDHLGIRKAPLILGHSMGGFVAAVAAAEHPQRIGSVLMVDGGLPLLDLPPLDWLPFRDFLIERVVKHLIGPSLTRLGTTFPSLEAYRDFWRAHPALKDSWSPSIERYVDYDLVGDAPALRPSTPKKAVLQDARTQLFEDLVPRSLAALSCPVHFLRAPRGVMNGKPLYAPARLARAGRRVRHFRSSDVGDVNHYTIMLSERGACAVATEIRRMLAEYSPPQT